jgi:hypothetical protein
MAGRVLELLGMLDERMPGQIPPLLRAERHLARAPLAARDGDHEAAKQATAEATEIATRLRCQPLLDRAADLAPAPHDLAR